MGDQGGTHQARVGELNDVRRGAQRGPCSALESFRARFRIVLVLLS